MKLDLHRSFTFWSGLLVMVFIVWAWKDSTRWRSLAGYDHWCLEQEDCGLRVSWTHIPQIQSGRGMWRQEVSHEIRGAGMRMTSPLYFRKALGESEDESEKRYLARYGEAQSSGESGVFYSTVPGDPGDWACYIPHWCLLAGVAAVWAGLLVWRARRRKRPIFNHQSSNHQSKCFEER